MRYKRRPSRKLEDLPSLFSEEEIYSPEQQPEALRVEPPRPIDDEPFDGPPTLSDDFSRPLKRLRFMSFGSGSSGNCAYIGTHDCGVLIDAGVNFKFVESEMAKNGISPASIKGIVLTHDHGDHVKFAYALVRRFSTWKLFATPRTIEGVLRRHNLSRRIRDYHSPIYKEHNYTFGDITMTPFATSHDGADNLGFIFTLADTKFVVCTDTGIITQRSDHYLRQATAMMLESNYDSDMLTRGRYKDHLKARIRSEIGHLDNVMTANYLASTFRPTLTHIFLCHLSEENNTPEIALAQTRLALQKAGIEAADTLADAHSGRPFLTALPRYSSSELYVL